MINIISLSLFSNKVSGPKKVAENLIKGLEKLNYPYIINGRLDSCKRLWIHSDVGALEKLPKLDPKIKVVIGPNLFIPARNFPNLPRHLDFTHVVYLQPSEWIKKMELDFGFNQCPIEVWPTGIDSNEFKPSPNSSNDYVLIYSKQRFDNELRSIIEILNQRNILFKIIKYRHYNQKEYLTLLHNCRYLIWLGRVESQGIALEEALSCNIPILLFDVSYVYHWIPAEDEKTLTTKEMEKYVGQATSAPYFDSSCGIKVKEIDQLPSAIDHMENDWQNFSPREYILKNLSLEKQAKDFLGIYEKYWGLSYRDGLEEKVLRRGHYKSEFLCKSRYISLNFIKKYDKIFNAYRIFKSKIKNKSNQLKNIFLNFTR